MNVMQSPLLASAISVDFDLTFLAQFLLFATFVTLLKPLLFDPLLKVFEEREKRTDGAKKQARDMDEEAAALKRKRDDEMEKVRREASVEREKIRAETARIEAKIMAEARADAANVIEAGRARLADEMTVLRAELERMKPELASQIASRILDREVAQ